ncbi:photosystem II biogenesis protein Psp29 [Merismopedia glauca]|uniref:Protein Thf1 n=1 Tax=Merismopedia glauca CCAP 1448/3 TaxID=1296344 RepID=A0A2T1C1C6_9CYAN|nr:photosystem II biogenesis protein Psp29 [Merismopedia glauca]PSB01978.1 photosystem II biogenesis protein Psp29 [Merismopedia glauca CCAP 1448/3]
MNNLRTVSDTKRDFYTHHTRPINSIYRRVVEELMVEMHLLAVNADFAYNPIYALGVVTAFNKFMQGYRPEKDRDSIFNALCRSVQDDPQRYQNDAQQLEALAKNTSSPEVIEALKTGSVIGNPTSFESSFNLDLGSIANNSKFKYSRLLGIGLFSLLELSGAEAIKDAKQQEELFKEIAQGLKLPGDKLQKDLELYRTNLEKMAQIQQVLADTLQADRKKREQRAQEKEAAATETPTPTPDA